MNTLYDLFKVKENASLEEITESYNKILKNTASLPQTDDLVHQVQKIKIAYGILSDTEKRQKYDSDLSTKRANELLENVQAKPEKIEPTEENLNIDKKPDIDENKMKQAILDQVNRMAQAQASNNLETEKQQKLEEKQRKKELRRQKRAAKKQQELKREMEMQAYGRYLEKQGYKVKYPWTWCRVKRLAVSILAIIIGIFILWHIPFVKNALINLYEENFVIKFLVDAIKSIFNG